MKVGIIGATYRYLDMWMAVKQAMVKLETSNKLKR